MELEVRVLSINVRRLATIAWLCGATELPHCYGAAPSRQAPRAKARPEPASRRPAHQHARPLRLAHRLPARYPSAYIRRQNSTREFFSQPMEYPMPSSQRQKDVCDLLDADHKAVKKMFKEFESLTESRARNAPQQRLDLARQICVELTV